MLGHCTPRESDMVRGTQNKDGLHHPVVFIKMDRGTCLWKPWFKKDEPWVDLSEAVSSSWSRVAISSMGANHSARRRTL